MCNRKINITIFLLLYDKAQGYTVLVIIDELSVKNTNFKWKHTTYV